MSNGVEDRTNESAIVRYQQTERVQGQSMRRDTKRKHPPYNQYRSVETGPSKVRSTHPSDVAGSGTLRNGRSGSRAAGNGGGGLGTVGGGKSGFRTVWNRRSGSGAIWNWYSRFRTVGDGGGGFMTVGDGYIVGALGRDWV